METRRKTLSSVEVCAATGVTYRQLDYWTRTGRVPVADGSPTPGSGSQRHYTVATAVLMRALRLASDVGRGPTLSAAGGLLFDRRFDHVAVEIEYMPEMQLRDCWLVIEPDRAYVIKGKPDSEAALFVDLHRSWQMVMEGIELLSAPQAARA